MTDTAEAFGGFNHHQLANAYGAFGLYPAGDNGSGQHIAIFELEPFDKSDVQTFDTLLLRREHGRFDGRPTYTSSTWTSFWAKVLGFGESILDIQDVSVFAPGASIDVYQAPNTTFGALDEYARIVNDDVDQVVTTSWGLCEQ